jgi:hypothetical protein
MSQERSTDFVASTLGTARQAMGLKRAVTSNEESALGKDRNRILYFQASLSLSNPNLVYTPRLHIHHYFSLVRLRPPSVNQHHQKSEVHVI